MEELSEKQKLLIALLEAAGNSQATPLLDPIRIMKALFILCKKIPENYISNEDRYQFKPYLYGPYSSEVYDDLAILEKSGFVTRTTLQWRNWSYYSLTKKGREKAEQILKTYQNELSEYIKSICNFVQRNDFASILEKVYKAFPEYAAESVFTKRTA
jgi:uncharacterized protein YwgA